MAVRRATRAQDQKEKREDFCPVSNVWRPCTHTLTHTATGTYSVMLINPHLHTKDTGQHKDSAIKRRKGAHDIKCMCTKSFTLEDLKIGFLSGRGCEKDIIVSFWGVFIRHLLFSPSHQSLSAGKIRSDPFHKFLVFLLSQPRKVQFVYSSFYVFFFFISIFVGATARHPQHTDDKRSAKGKGPERRVH